MASIIDDTENGAIKLGVIVALVAVIVAAVIAVKGLSGFFAWAQGAYNKLFNGWSLPWWLKPEEWAAVLNRWAANLDMNAPLGRLFNSFADALQNLSAPDGGAGGPQVYTGTRGSDPVSGDPLDSGGGDSVGGDSVDDYSGD